MRLSPEERRILIDHYLYRGLDIAQYSDPQSKADEVRLAAEKVVAAAHAIASSKNAHTDAHTDAYTESKLRLSLAELIAVSEYWLGEL